MGRPWLQQEISEFFSVDMWSTNRPDLNPAHYRIWGLMADRVCLKTPLQPRHRRLEASTSLIGSRHAAVFSTGTGLSVVPSETVDQWRIWLCVRATMQKATITSICYNQPPSFRAAPRTTTQSALFSRS